MPTELIMDANLHVEKEGYARTDGRYSGIRDDGYVGSARSLPVAAGRGAAAAAGAMAVINGTVPLPKRIISPVVRRAEPYDFAALAEDIEAIIRCYPFVRRRTIGHSVLGLPLVELQIGRGPVRVHMNGSFHANEWITTAVVMALIDDYLRALVDDAVLAGHRVLEYYHKVTLSIVPMVNPDGVNLVLNGPPEEEPHRSEAVRINGSSLDFSQWKANIRGVDLNNQFPARWEIEQARKPPKAPAPRDFPGFAPLTEPEAKAMAALAETSDFAMVVAFHTQGKEIYWGYEGLEPQRRKQPSRRWRKQADTRLSATLTAMPAIEIGSFRRGSGAAIRSSSARASIRCRSRNLRKFTKALGLFLATLKMA
ncbi:peptidase M14 [Bacillus megaterium]|nr:peptidase M14 [Priestia megaterium]